MPILVIYDERMMRHIVSNLISNALKYSTNDKKIYVTLSQVNGTVLFSVRDEGIGIPQQDQKHLYEPFHRATNVGTISGTGLGLSITKQAVELHNGVIKLESEIGKGTTFTVNIPNTIYNRTNQDVDTIPISGGVK
jgi:signal transduction histidine kinase